MAAAGVDYTRIWWDARPHPRLGTLEVRIADQATSVDRAAALVALVQALCAAPPEPGPTLLDAVEPAARELGTWELVEPLREPSRRCGSSRSGGATGSRRSPPISCDARRHESLRAALYPLRLVGARLGRRSAPVVLVVLGIAAGAAVVLGGRAGALVAQDRAVAQAVERIPDGQRSVRAVWFGVPGQSDEPQPALDGVRGARWRAPTPAARRRSSSSARPRSAARSPASAASRGSAAG